LPNVEPNALEDVSSVHTLPSLVPNDNPESGGCQVGKVGSATREEKRDGDEKSLSLGCSATYGVLGGPIDTDRENVAGNVWKEDEDGASSDASDEDLECGGECIGFGALTFRNGGADSVRSGPDDKPVTLGRRGVDADVASFDGSGPSVASRFPIAWKSNPARVGMGAWTSSFSVTSSELG